MKTMSWYYKKQGIHVHVRVFMNGALCGQLCFRNEEFEQVRVQLFSTVDFITNTTP